MLYLWDLRRAYTPFYPKGSLTWARSPGLNLLVLTPGDPHFPSNYKPEIPNSYPGPD